MNGSDHIYLQHWLRHRDANAFQELTAKYSGLVYATSLRITRDRTEAEDVTQECFAALSTVARVPRSPLGAWLHRVATNDSLNRIKARQRRETREERYARNRAISVEIEWRDIDLLVDEIIAELPERLRVPIVARFIEGESYTSIAKSQGTTRQTVTQRVEKGIKLLRKGLEKRGVSVPLAALGAMMATELSHASAVSAATSASLGKMALAGSVNSITTGGATAVSSGATILGGVAMTKSTMVGVGAAVALILGGAVYTLQDEGVPSETTTEDLTVSDVGTLNEAAATISALTDEVAQSQVRIAELEATLASVQADSLRTGSGEGRDAETSATEGDSGEDKSGIKVTGKLNFAIDPGTQMETAGKSRYNALFALLGLPANVQADVRQVLIENLGDLAIAGTSRRALQSGKLEQGVLEDSLASLLTKEELDLWKDYENNIEYYQRAHRYSLGLMEDAPGLTAENRDVISSALAEERLAWVGSGTSTGITGNWQRDFEVLGNTHLQLAGTFEDEEQGALFSDYVTQQQSILQERLDLVSDGKPVMIEFPNSNDLGGTSISIGALPNGATNWSTSVGSGDSAPPTVRRKVLNQD